MKRNFKEIAFICFTAGAFCMSAQSEVQDIAATTEETQEISWGSCKESTGKEDCKLKEKSSSKSKDKSAPRKGAAKRVLDGS